MAEQREEEAMTEGESLAAGRETGLGAPHPPEILSAYPSIYYTPLSFNSSISFCTDVFGRVERFV